MINETNQHRNQSSRIWLGIIFIVAGFCLLAEKLGAPVPHWLFSWQMLLIVLGIHNGIKHRFQNAGWVILIGVGSVFLIDEQLPEINFHDYLWPILIITIGALFIARPKQRMFGNWGERRRLRRENRWGYATEYTNAYPIDHDNTDASSDTFNINSIFSGIKRTVISKNFQGGSISCVFGGVDIDLTQADINGKVVIFIEEVFGGIKLVIPPHWTVDNQVDGAFHGVEDKRKYNGSIRVDADKVLVLKGSATFAGIDIRSY